MVEELRHLLHHLLSDCNIATPGIDLLALRTCGIGRWSRNNCRQACDFFCNELRDCGCRANFSIKLCYIFETATH
jgi:hypothetical protein